MPERAAHDALEWGCATRCRRGEVTSGDLAVVSPLPDGVLVGVIDGVGHGSGAAHAARKAGDALREQPSQDLAVLAERCHLALKGTRGAALSLAFVHAGKALVTWLGIGNVEGRVVSGDPAAPRPRSSLALETGVPGHELPRARTATLPVHPGDLLILATDGIEPSFGEELDVSGSTQAISERIVADHWKPFDDALVVAVRYLGARS
jgi:serine phosphatase RsbU (regulator of sigma subunit)